MVSMYKINKARHSAYLLHAHIVFVTKYRRPVLGELHLSAFKDAASEVCTEFEADLKECDGEADHVHLLIEYNPKVQLTKLINSLKAVTSRRMRNEFVDLRAAYDKPVLWSRSYFVGSCGGAPLEVVAQYVKNQRG